MSLHVAQLLVTLTTAYAACGVVFVLLVLPRLVLRLDTGLGGASVVVRLLLAPGLGALWPLFVWRLLSSSGPPLERNPHRDLATVRSAVPNRRSGSPT